MNILISAIIAKSCCLIFVSFFLLLKVPGVFISRLVRGGLAESTGLLGVNDEILEVNGIDVAGKSLDQVNALPGSKKIQYIQKKIQN